MKVFGYLKERSVRNDLLINHAYTAHSQQLKLAGTFSDYWKKSHPKLHPRENSKNDRERCQGIDDVIEP
ncbi:unnamed protein product, partial [Iphiclides podalirius]